MIYVKIYIYIYTPYYAILYDIVLQPRSEELCHVYSACSSAQLLATYAFVPPPAKVALLHYNIL